MKTQILFFHKEAVEAEVVDKDRDKAEAEVAVDKIRRKKNEKHNGGGDVTDNHLIAEDIIRFIQKEQWLPPLALYSENEGVIKALIPHVVKRINIATEEENEAAAKLCDLLSDVLPDSAKGAKMQAKKCAESIRARRKK